MLLLILSITVIDISNLLGVVQCMLVFLLVVPIGVDGCISESLVCLHSCESCCWKCFFYYQCFFFLILLWQHNLLLMCNHSHLKNERGNKDDSCYQRHYPNRDTAFENHRNMDVIDIILCEDNHVKHKFLYYHDKDDANSDLHIPDLFFLRPWNQLRLKLDKHYAEEAVKNADETTNDDTRYYIVVEDANVNNGVLRVAKTQ